jgi:hypothetical protein
MVVEVLPYGLWVYSRAGKQTTREHYWRIQRTSLDHVENRHAFK